MWNGLYFISPPWKENQNNWCSVPPLHSVAEINSFCLGSKIFSHACKLHHPHLFFPVVKSLSAHPGLCIMEALALSRSSDVFPWPAGQGWHWEGFCFVLSSPSRTCLLPCTSGHQLGQGNAALCALEMAQSSRGDHESTQHCWENCAKCCENTAGNNKPSGVKVQLHRNNVQNFCNLAVENGSDRPFPGN